MPSANQLRFEQEQIVADVRSTGERVLMEDEIFRAFGTEAPGDAVREFAAKHGFSVKFSDSVPVVVTLSLGAAVPEFDTANGVRIIGTAAPPAVEGEQPERIIITFRLRLGEKFLLALDPTPTGLTLVGAGPERDFDPKVPIEEWKDKQPPLYGVVNIVDREGIAYEEMLTAALYEWLQARREYFTDPRMAGQRYGRAGDTLQQLIGTTAPVVQPTLYAIVRCEACSYMRAVDSWRENEVQLVGTEGKAGPSIVTDAHQSCPRCAGVKAVIVRVVTTTLGLDRLMNAGTKRNGGQ